MIRACLAAFGILGLLAVMRPYVAMLGIAGALTDYNQDYLLPVLTGSILLGLASLGEKVAIVTSAVGFLVVVGGLVIPWFMSGASQGPQMSAGFVMICGVVPLGVAVQVVGVVFSILSPGQVNPGKDCHMRTDVPRSARTFHVPSRDGFLKPSQVDRQGHRATSLVMKVTSRHTGTSGE